jgi:hypothetical protein
MGYRIGAIVSYLVGFWPIVWGLDRRIGELFDCERTRLYWWGVGARPCAPARIAAGKRAVLLGFLLENFLILGWTPVAPRAVRMRNARCLRGWALPPVKKQPGRPHHDRLRVELEGVFGHDDGAVLAYVWLRICCQRAGGILALC